MRTTREILSEAEPLPSRKSNEISNFPVSSKSLWNDDRWVLDHVTAGQTDRQVQFRWNIPLSDGTRFTDAKWADLCEDLRRFVWSLYADAYFGKPLKETSMGRLYSGIRPLVIWMTDNDLRSFGALNPSICQRFLYDTVDQVIDATTEDDSPAFTSIWIRLRALILIYEQTPALVAMGVTPMASHPFPGASAFGLTKQYVVRQVSRIHPLPDEVAIPLIAAAYRLIGKPADDIIRLQSRVIAARNAGLPDLKHGPGDSKSSKSIAARQAACSFKFSVLPGENEPWHPRITYPGKHQTEFAQRPLQVVRRLVLELRDAAIVILQSLTGMRINEICSIEKGLDVITGVPACIKIRKSKNSLHEIFYLKATLSKTQTVATEHEWVIGMRTIGSDYVPPTVRALEVLERLFRTWRVLSNANSLIVSFNAPSGLPTQASSISSVTGDDLLAGLKRFAETHLDYDSLPDTNAYGQDLRPYKQSRGKCITTHQWRKAWALYVYRTDPRMLPAIAQQFKHLSLAMTEQGYIGNDPLILEALDSVSAQRTSRFFYDIATGRSKIAGGMASVLSDYQDELLDLIDQSSGPEDQPALDAWVRTHDLRIFFTDYGKCMIGTNPSASRCNSVAGTSGWSSATPNYKTREPSLCLGCACFAVDAEHIQYWENRERAYSSAYIEAKRKCRGDELTIARARSKQAKQILSVIRSRALNNEESQ